MVVFSLALLTSQKKKEKKRKAFLETVASLEERVSVATLPPPPPPPSPKVKTRKNGITKMTENKRGLKNAQSKGLCAQMDALAEKGISPRFIKNSNSTTTAKKRKLEGKSEESNKKLKGNANVGWKIVVEAKSSDWRVIQDTFISKRFERVSMVKTVLSNANEGRWKNFIEYQNAIMSIIEDHEKQKITQMVLRRSFKLNSS